MQETKDWPTLLLSIHDEPFILLHMKHEWRKHEKALYLPKNQPEFLTVPSLKFFTIRGQGNPNEAFFAEYIGVLYSLAYAVKMNLKKGPKPEGYADYTVYPLEGVWDISDEAKQRPGATFTKDDFVFDLMIRQPDFVTDEFASDMLDLTKQKKPHELLDQVQFTAIEEGLCVQMLHNGPYDDEPASFRLMEEFAEQQQLTRLSKIHREIYLTDSRKTPPEKQKTVLRFQVSDAGNG